MFQNWKSTMAFFTFIGIYGYSVYFDKSDSIVDTAGYVALLSSVFMMFRSQITTDMLKALLDNISKKK